MSTIIGLVSTFRLPLQIGRWSGEKAVESPKEKPRRGGLDVRVERGQ